MKNLLSISAFGALFLLASTGCLKDKGYDNQNYGIKDQDIKGVAFPQSASSPLLGSINSQTTPTVIQGPFVTLEESGYPGSNVTVTIAEDNTLVTAEGYDPLPAGTYTLSGTSVVINAGTKSSDAIKITIPNSTVLDPTKTYGIGIKITAVDQGYKIAANQKQVVVGFTIKNKFDGVYKLKVRSTGWAAYGIADGPTFTYNGDFDVATVGANTVSLFSNYRGDDLLPAFTSTGGPTAFGATTPQFEFDNTTNLLTNVINTTPDDGRGRALELNTAVTDSRFDPATKTIYAAFIMKQNGRPNQFFYDTLTFIRER